MINKKSAQLLGHKRDRHNTGVIYPLNGNGSAATESLYRNAFNQRVRKLLHQHKEEERWDRLRKQFTPTSISVQLLRESVVRDVKEAYSLVRRGDYRGRVEGEKEGEEEGGQEEKERKKEKGNEGNE